LTHNANARAASASEIVSRRNRPSASTGTDTARQLASVAPISYVGYEIAGYKIVSRSGVRSLSHCGNVATNSFEPTQAAICATGTDTSNRRCIHSANAVRNGAVPIDAG